MRLSIHQAAVLLAACYSLTAPMTAQIGPTLTGFVFDEASRSLRPVLGTPGSALIGSAVAEEIDGAWASPNARWAVVRKDTRTLAIAGIDRLQAVELTDARLLSSLSTAVWSADGGLAVLYSAATAQVQRVRLQDGVLDVEPPMQIRHVGDAVPAIAAGNDGRILMGSASGVYATSDDGTVNRIAETGPVTAIVFAPTSDRAYCIAGSAVVELAGIGSTVSHRSLIADLPEPVGLAVQAGAIYAATSGDGKLRRYDSDGNPVSELQLDRKPAGVQPLAGRFVFLLNGTEGKHLPIAVFDARRDPAVFFVPFGSVSSSL